MPKKKYEQRRLASMLAQFGSLYAPEWDEHEVQALREAFGLELTLSLREVTPDFANTIGALRAESSAQ